VAYALAWFLDYKGKTPLNQSTKPKVTFITSSMNLGGAERQLLLLCKELQLVIDIEIITLDSSGPLFEKFKEDFPEIKVVESSNHFTPILVLLIRRILLEKRPDVVITWLYKADILGGLASKLARNIPVIWSARNSSIPNFSLAKRRILKYSSFMLPKFVVANGMPALEFHTSLGYEPAKLRRIPNLLSPWTQITQSRSRLFDNLDSEVELRVGIAARQVPGKGILEAIQSVMESKNMTHIVDLQIIGQSTSYSKKWKDMNLYHGYEVREISADVALSEWFSGLDLYLMPSTMWESQPNSLIEAIAIGCPILVSDAIDLELEIPDSYRISVRDTGWLRVALDRILEFSPKERRGHSDALREQALNLYQTEAVSNAWLSVINEAKK
jgi:glycosyltransferase involved in cell wall biosynthesis